MYPFSLFDLEPTLTVPNLHSAVQEVEELDHLARCLDIPKVNQHHRSIWNKWVIIENFVRYHPAPSWKIIAECFFKLQYFYGKHKYLGALQAVKKKYFEGKKMFACSSS